MKRTNIIRLLPGKVQKQTIKLLGNRVSALWNAANFLCRQEFFKGNKIPSYSRLCDIFNPHPDYKNLPSDIAQEVLKKLSKAWVGYFSLIKLYTAGKLKDKPGIPGYRKDRKKNTRPFDFIPIKSPRTYSIESGCLNITLPADIRSGNGDRLSIPFRGILRHQGKLKTCEIGYDDANRVWHAHIVVGISKPQRKEKPVKYAAGDIGARRTIAVSIEDNNTGHIFSSRELYKDYKYWTRQIAGIQSQLSIQGLKTSRRLKQLYRMRKNRLIHGLETLSKRVVTVLKREGATHFKVGYPKGCRGNMDFGKVNGLVHNFWCFDIFLDILEKHCTRRGIGFERMDESGTSNTCHICDSVVKRPIRSVVVCPVHGKTHADINASLNMLKKFAPIYGDGEKASPAWATHEWNKYSWLPRAKSLEYIQGLAA